MGDVVVSSNMGLIMIDPQFMVMLKGNKNRIHQDSYQLVLILDYIVVDKWVDPLVLSNSLPWKITIFNRSIIYS